MEQILAPLITQGGFGIIAALFFWLYLSERNEHKETRKEVTAQLEARRTDALDARKEITLLATGTSDALLRIGDKIQNSKGQT